MKNFKVEASKGNKKFDFYKRAENEMFLREELHKEGFTILSIEKIDSINVSGEKYYFEILQNGELKNGTISSTDIFKAYLKIKDDLGYDLKYIYYKLDSSEDEKQKIIKDLNYKYELFKKDSFQKKTKNELQEEKNQVKADKSNSIDNFQMKKELDESLKMISRVIEKLRYILSLEETEYLNKQRKEKLEEIYTVIITLKASNNIIKLKQIGEAALTKIGEVELYLLEEEKNDEIKVLLKETNKLLKKVGSKKSFVEKNKDINYLMNKYSLKVINFFKKTEQKQEKKIEKIDKQSYIFLKNRVLYEKYTKRLADINKLKLNNLKIYFIYTKENNELRENLALKTKVLEQNKKILQKRLTGKEYSYVKLKKGYNYFLEKFLNFLKTFADTFFIIITFYSLFFSIYLLLKLSGLINYELNLYGVFNIIYFILGFILLSLSRNFILFFINIVILLFLFIFGVINM